MKTHANKSIPLDRVAASIRKDILLMSYRSKSAHTGGSLSVVEILVALYFSVMKVYPKNPYHAKRDRLVFSKAHDAKALYATLAARGYFDKSLLESYEQDGGFLPGHSTRHCIAGVEATAGSLGHGLSICCGMAQALKSSGSRVFSILSDGECDEGSTWEAAMFAGHHELDNLIAIVDYNKLQGFGFTEDVLNLEPFAAKWKSFGWHVIEVAHGHDINGLIDAFSYKHPTKPIVFLIHTIKGYGGVPQHLGQISSQYISPNEEELAVLGML